MKYIRIVNQGLLEVEALTLMGASTKVGDSSKIGQFGSGNKYAIAYFLRNNYDFMIFSGMDQIEMTTERTTFRGHDFDVIKINGEKTSITTEMGKDWEAWQALREIYCNAMDEGEEQISVVTHPVPKEGKTVFYIEMKIELEDIIVNFDNYFSSDKEVLYECGIGQILKKTGDTTNIYRRGVKCTNLRNNSIYDYNLYDIDINEDRLAEYYWQVEEHVWRLIFKAESKEVIERIFNHLNEGMFEHDISSSSALHGDIPSPMFKETVGEMKLCSKEMAGNMKQSEYSKFTLVPEKIFSNIKQFLEDDNMPEFYKVTRDGGYVDMKPTPTQEDKLRKALNFLGKAGFIIPYEVKIGKFHKKDMLGYADLENEVIIISETNMEAGVTEIVNTIIEEFIHIKYGVFDETRGFQTAVIGEFISYMKSKEEHELV